MGKYAISAIRNLALIGHGSVGKTSLAEAILKHAGLVSRIPAGVMDYAADEKERGYSIDSAIAHFSWQDKEINMIDVPGYQEFYQNAIGCLSVVETAVIVVSAVDGITVNAKRVWDIAKNNGLAKIIVMTKLDVENASFERTLAQIQENLGKNCVPLIVPDSSGAQFSKVTNILKEGNSEYKDKLIEITVETNDELLNKYLEGEKISQEVLDKQLKQAVMNGQIVPIIAAHPLKETGIKELLEVITDFTPSPLDVPQKKGKSPNKSAEPVSFAMKEEEPFSARVFKVFNDPFGRIVYFRVYSGTLASSTSIYNVNSQKTERIASVFHVFGKELKAIDKAIPGDIVAIGKVESPKVGDTLCVEKTPIVYEAPQYPTPMVGVAIQPKSRGDEQKIIVSLQKLTEEDPTFVLKREEETHELVVAAMSNLHLDIMISRLKNRFKVECTTTIPKIPYRETILGKGESRYRHKKQTGGHGEFAEVAIKIEPAERGKGFDFRNEIVGGVIPSQFVASTQKGISGIMTKGILAGFPVVDVTVHVWDGKTHEVDSSDAAFQMAGSRAFQEAFLNSKPVLLEPVENIEITVPAKYMGDIMGHLNSKRGRIMGSSADGNYQVIKAIIPLVEVLNYSTELKSMTGGEGAYSLSFSHYDPVPGNLQEKIIAKSKEEKEKEKK